MVGKMFPAWNRTVVMICDSTASMGDGLKKLPLVSRHGNLS
jgi:hypothetical protein